MRPGQSIELLKELHILTREGKINQDSRRKLKQVLHLFQFIEKILKELSEEDAAKALKLSALQTQEGAALPMGRPDQHPVTAG